MGERGGVVHEGDKDKWKREAWVKEDSVGTGRIGDQIIPGNRADAPLYYKERVYGQK